MLSSSKKLLEGLLYKVPKLLSIYKIIDLGSTSSSDHAEYDNILNHFSDPYIIIAVGLTTSCFVIQREAKQAFHVIEIGSEVYYTKLSAGKLKKRIAEVAKQRDFIPEPLTRKLVLVSKYDKKQAEGEIYMGQTTTQYIHSEPDEKGVYHSYRLNGLIQVFLNSLPIINEKV